MDVYSALSALFNGDRQKDADPRTATLFGNTPPPDDQRGMAGYAQPIETVDMQTSAGWDQIIDVIRKRLGVQTPEPQRRP